MSRSVSFAPKFAWRTKVGRLQARNLMVNAGSSILVGTCGDRWNARDGRDGVHSLSQSGGEHEWFTSTLSDVNEIALAGRELIVPTDDGDVFVLSRSNGEVVSVFRADSAVFGRPLVHTYPGGWAALFASHLGSIYLLRSDASHAEKIGEVDGRIRASLTGLSSEQFLAASEDGRILRLKLEGTQLTSQCIAEVPRGQYGGPVAISAAPLVEGSRAYIVYARETYDTYPAVMCLDLDIDGVRWVANNTNDKSYYGNVRSTPVLTSGALVVVSAYSDGLDILSPQDGGVVGHVPLGQTVFQQWSAPVRLDDSHVAVARVDGVLSVVDIPNRKLVASISVATASREKTSVVSFDNDVFALSPNEPPPDGAVCGTPLFVNGRIFLGTTDGELVGIDLE